VFAVVDDVFAVDDVAFAVVDGYPSSLATVDALFLRRARSSKSRFIPFPGPPSIGHPRVRHAGGSGWNSSHEPEQTVEDW